MIMVGTQNSAYRDKPIKIHMKGSLITLGDRISPKHQIEFLEGESGENRKLVCIGPQKKNPENILRILN